MTILVSGSAYKPPMGFSKPPVETFSHGPGCWNSKCAASRSTLNRSEGFPRTGYFIPGRDGMGAWQISGVIHAARALFEGVLGRFGVVDLSGFTTEILRFRRNPMFQEKSYDHGLDPTTKV